MAFSFLFVLLFFCALPFFASVLPFFPYLDTGHMENNCICLQAKPSCKQNHWKCCAYFAGKMLAIWRATSKQLWGNGGATKSLVIFAISKSSTQVNYKNVVSFYLLMPKHWSCWNHCLNHTQTHSCWSCLEHSWRQYAFQDHMAPSDILSHIVKAKAGPPWLKQISLVLWLLK